MPTTASPSTIGTQRMRPSSIIATTSATSAPAVIDCTGEVITPRTVGGTARSAVPPPCRIPLRDASGPQVRFSHHPDQMTVVINDRSGGRPVPGQESRGQHCRCVRREALRWLVITTLALMMPPIPSSGVRSAFWSPTAGESKRTDARTSPCSETVEPATHGARCQSGRTLFDMIRAHSRATQAATRTLTRRIIRMTLTCPSGFLSSVVIRIAAVAA